MIGQQRRGIKYITLWLCLAFVTAFSFSPTERIEPTIALPLAQQQLAKLPSPFPPREESRELFLGKAFAREGDYYRAITHFKEAQFLHQDRHEADYCLFLSYYLAGKYDQAATLFEESSLPNLTPDFPAYKQLIATLFDCYLRQKNEQKMRAMLQMMRTTDPQATDKLMLYQQLMLGSLPTGEEQFILAFTQGQLSPHLAGLFNALLPGAGYWYIGQPQSGITSLCLNALFIAAAYQFFLQGQWAAMLIAGGFEAGWYVGGINGAGRAANQYNEALWSSLAKELMIQHKASPLFMVEYGF